MATVREFVLKLKAAQKKIIAHYRIMFFHNGKNWYFSVNCLKIIIFISQFYSEIT